MVLCNVLGLSSRAIFLARKNLFRSTVGENRRFLSLTHALLKGKTFPHILCNKISCAI